MQVAAVGAPDCRHTADRSAGGITSTTGKHHGHPALAEVLDSKTDSIANRDA